MQQLKDVFRKIFILITSERTAALLLSIMSIVISYISLKNDSVSKEIAQKELEILENDREAYFVIEEENVKENPEADEYFNLLQPITIQNKGGRINGAYITPISYLDIYVHTFIPETNFFDSRIYRIKLENSFNFEDIESGSTYDTKTKTFSYINKDSIEFYRFLGALSDNIIVEVPYSEAGATRSDIVRIQYSNYQNINKDVKYLITSHGKSAALKVVTSDSFYETDDPVIYLSHTFTDYAVKDIDEITKLIYQNTQSLIEKSGKDSK